MVAKAFIILVIFFVDGFFSFMVFFWFDDRVMSYCRCGVCPPLFLDGCIWSDCQVIFLAHFYRNVIHDCEDDKHGCIYPSITVDDE